MPSFAIQGSRHFAIATTFFAVLATLCGRLEAQNQPNDQTAVGTPSQSPVRIKVASNLVVVRVVVRDAQGKPVEGLQKEDFKLFDRGKEQSITQFDVRLRLRPVNFSSGSLSRTSRQPADYRASKAPVRRQRFLAVVLRRSEYVGRGRD